MDGLAFEVMEGEVLGLVGPNGSGKTTALNLVTGNLRPDAGRILMHGRDLAREPAHVIARLGVARTFQLVRVMAGLSIAENATLAAGGKAEGTILPATILDHATPAMRAYGEESFGPMVTVVRVKDEEEAIRVANDTEYGLSAAVFPRDIGRALGVAKQIETGICHINAPTVHDEAQMPFGGVKASGYGRFGGKAAIDAFTDLRWITIQTGPRPYPF